MSNKRGSVVKRYLEVNAQSRCEKCMLAVASGEKNCVAASIYFLQEKCQRNTGPAGC